MGEKKKMQRLKWEKGSTFIVNGPTKLFPKIIALFMKHCIGSWISIWATHYIVLLDSENALLPKCNIGSFVPFSHFFLLDFEKALLPKCDIGSLMPFLRSFVLDTISTKRQKVPMDVKI